jgi:hypothetical protein
MHKRHVHSGGDCGCSSSNHDTADGNGNSNGNGNGKQFRKRRKPRGGRLLLNGMLDEDLVIKLIQGLSAVILIGCGCTLWVKWIFPDGIDIWSGLVGALNIFEIGGPQHHGNHKYAKTPLKPSRHYTIPDAMPHIGDKSNHYALLRKEYDALELPSIQRKYQFSPLPMQNGTNSDPVPYDIYNCPDIPPEGYPFAWLLLDVLKHWPPDEPEPRMELHQGLCVFDYTKDLEKATTYRKAEVPFVVTNDPQVQRASQRWNAPRYMDRMLGSVKHRAEYSENNHFLYWNKPPSEEQRRKRAARQGRNPNSRHPWQHELELPKDWAEPTQMMRMTYQDWLDHANVTDDSGLLGPDQPHWYFRLIGCGETGPEGQCDTGSSEYLFDELPFFQPKESLYIVDPAQQKGIHCRFGMKGVIAENHFDGSRNMIAVFGGERRYILSHPSQCDFLSLLPKGHPSARHSAVDWSNPDLDQFPEFAMAKGNEVVLQAGDVLYLPTNWFHYIISLNLNYQCNTRSGINQDYMAPIHECGF